jgi:hypothetical protein
MAHIITTRTGWLLCASVWVSGINNCIQATQLNEFRNNAGVDKARIAHLEMEIFGRESKNLGIGEHRQHVKKEYEMGRVRNFMSRWL